MSVAGLLILAAWAGSMVVLAASWRRNDAVYARLQWALEQVRLRNAEDFEAGRDPTWRYVALRKAARRQVCMVFAFWRDVDHWLQDEPWVLPSGRSPG